jgi:hypothetical protein
MHSNKLKETVAFKLCSTEKCYFLWSFGGTWLNLGDMLAKQALNHLNHSTSPVWVGCF